MSNLNGLGTTDSLKFENLSFTRSDSGEFFIHDWKEEKELIGIYKGITKDHPLVDSDGNAKEMLEFTNFEGDRVLCDLQYKLYAFFVNRENGGEAIDWSKKVVFRITRLEDRKKKSGGVIAQFRIEHAYA
jgi:hypothetical protein